MRAASILPALRAAPDSPAFWSALRRHLPPLVPYRRLLLACGCDGEPPVRLTLSTGYGGRTARWWCAEVLQNPLRRFLAGRPRAGWARVCDLPRDRLGEWRAHRRRFSGVEGCDREVALVLRDRGRVAGYLSLRRSASEGEFGDGELAVLEDLAPDLARAFRRVRAFDRRRFREGPMSRLLMRLPVALAVADAGGHLLYLNREAREACLTWDRAGRPGAPRVKRSCACLPETIAEACRSAFAEGAAGEIQVRHPRDRRLCAWIRPPGAAAPPLGEAATLIRFGDGPGDPQGDLPVGTLTLAERELLPWLQQGLGNKEIASRLGKSPATVKTQIESVFRKLGIHGRLALIARLAAGATPHG